MPGRGDGGQMWGTAALPDHCLGPGPGGNHTGGGGDAGGGRDVPILPQNMGLGGESQPARPNAGHPGENPLMFLGSNVSGG